MQVSRIFALPLECPVLLLSMLVQSHAKLELNLVQFPSSFRYLFPCSSRSISHKIAQSNHRDIPNLASRNTMILHPIFQGMEVHTLCSCCIRNGAIIANQNVHSYASIQSELIGRK